MGAAQNFTVQYLDALKDILPTQNVESGNPEIDMSQVNTFTISRLQEAMKELYRSSLADSAIRDIRTAPSAIGDRGKFRTTAIGYADDFDMLVKMGFILGDQVVLWDAVLPNILFNPEGIHLDNLKATSRQILSWYPIVARGGLAYLPHPREWSPSYKRMMSIMEGIPGLTTDYLGLLTAESLTNDDYKLNPYALSHRTEELVELHKKLSGKTPNMEKLDKRESIRRFMRGASVYALRHVSPAGFFAAIESAYAIKEDMSSPMYQDNWRDQLAKYLEYDHSDDSPEEHEARRLEKLTALDNLAKQQAMILREEFSRRYKKTAEDAGFVAGAVGLIMGAFGAAVPASMIKVLGKAFGGYARFRNEFADKLPEPKNELVFQLFFDMEEEWDKELAEN